MRRCEWTRDQYPDEDRAKQKECEPVSADECATERKIVIVHREGAPLNHGALFAVRPLCLSSDGHFIFSRVMIRKAAARGRKCTQSTYCYAFFFCRLS
ncbi:hypothetical protein AVEN_203437-1 [Araneus ventricosus]|uniref:Uncharacterized protein n=1 Tax=Araneus ventricosus TaxID=182803 RepID=A0A4Y2BHS3_ARAVE|nr:hypothetical protein AVEN_203437-1 [Araneus ventricosus]